MKTGRAPRHWTLYDDESFSDQVLVERAAKQLELQQRRVAQHRERPLVRIRDERDALVLEDGGRAGDRRLVDARRRDELALGDRLREELRLRQRDPVAAGRPPRARAGRARRRRRRDCPSREKTPARVKSPRRAAQRFPTGSRTGSSASLSCAAEIGSAGASSSGLRMCRIARTRPPPHLQRYRDRGGATEDDLEEHAAAGGVDVGEIHVRWRSFGFGLGLPESEVCY